MPRPIKGWLRDLRRINELIGPVACPILDDAGTLRESRAPVFAGAAFSRLRDKD